MCHHRPPESLGHLFPMGYQLEFFTKGEMRFQKMTSHLICTSLGSKYDDPNFTENKTEGKLSLSGGKGGVGPRLWASPRFKSKDCVLNSGFV